LFKLWTPTTSELEELTIHWLSPWRLDLNSSKGNAVRRSPTAISPSQAPWEERLGISPQNNHGENTGGNNPVMWINGQNGQERSSETAQETTRASFASKEDRRQNRFGYLFLLFQVGKELRLHSNILLCSKPINFCERNEKRVGITQSLSRPCARMANCKTMTTLFSFPLNLVKLGITHSWPNYARLITQTNLTITF
jgi:hypothetical protein